MSYYTQFSGSFTTPSAIPLEVKAAIDSLYNDGGNDEATIKWPRGIRVPEGSAYSPWCIVNSELKFVDDIGSHNHNYYYVEWLCQIIQHFLHPNGIKISGSVKWQGDDPRDHGEIRVKDNVVAISCASEDQADFIEQCNAEVLSTATLNEYDELEDWLEMSIADMTLDDEDLD